MKNTRISLNIVLSVIHIVTAAAAALTATHQLRTADTCADASLATVFINIFSPTRTAHGVRERMEMVAYDSDVGTSDNFQFQGPSFLAWITPQEFTTPFHQLITPSGNDIIYLPEVNGTAPKSSGFIDQGIVGYAYTTQICGSVPLFEASNSASSDHFWTTSQADHARLLTQSGWVDAGIPFYVLPLDSCSGCAN